MILDCGETWDAKKARLSEWHPFFALLPRRVAVVNGRHKCAWLETIERKGIYRTLGYPYYMLTPDWWQWVYRSRGDK